MIKEKQKGMTLLEVLVTMLIIGIAIIGSIAMLQVSVKSNQNANYQSMALYAAQQIISKMRDNIDNISKYEVNWDTQALLNESRKDSKCFELSANCSPDAWVENDLINWSKDLLLTLPEPSVRITNQSKVLPGNNYEVSISWKGNNLDGGNSATQIQSVDIPFPL